MITCFFIGHRNVPETLRPLLDAAIKRHITEYGVSGCSIGGGACEVQLPQAGVAMSDRLFCRKHRLMLAIAEGRGFALLDLHESGTAIPYIVAKGVKYEINGYTVSVEADKRPFGWIVSVV